MSFGFERKGGQVDGYHFARFGRLGRNSPRGCPTAETGIARTEGYSGCLSPLRLA